MAQYDYPAYDHFSNMSNMTWDYDEDYMYTRMVLDRLVQADYYMKRVGYGIGLTCNFITIIVFVCNRYFLDGPNVYLVSQIFVDFLIILTNLLRMLDNYTGDRVSSIHFFCILHINILLIFHFLSYWLIVLYSGFWLRRAHCHRPNRRHHPTSLVYPSCNCPHLGILVAIGFIGLVFYFHLWWMMDGCQFLGMWFSFIETWRQVDRFVNALLPRLITAVLAPVLGVYYWRTRRWLRSAESEANGRQASRQTRHSFAEQRHKLMEPIVVALPTFITLLCLPREMNLVIYPRPVGPRPINHILDLLLEVTYISKFFLLLVFSPAFRKALISCVKRRRGTLNTSSLSTQRSQSVITSQPGPSGPTAV